MTPDETKAQQIERDRRRSEEELLLLLLLLLDDARRDVAFALRHQFSPRIVLNNTIIGRAVPIIYEAMADAHDDGARRFTAFRDNERRAPRTRSKDEMRTLARVYQPDATEAARAMVDTLDRAVQAAQQDAQVNAPDVSEKTIARAAFESVGYTITSSYGLEQGVERAIVKASNVGMISAAMQAMQATPPYSPGIVMVRPTIGIRHISVVDSRTTDICLDRAGLTLPADHPYWQLNVPPLHPRCRSVLAPVWPPFIADTVLPTVSPALGWGAMPQGFFSELLAA